MTKPQRIQLKRTKGWRMPENTVKVDRTTVFGNPFPVGENCTAKQAVQLYRRWIKSWSQAKIMRTIFDGSRKPNPMGGLSMIMHRNLIRERLTELRGKNLACWCKPSEPCHADVLLELANSESK